MILALAMSLAQAAAPMAGLSWTPLSRADLVWVEDGRTTGTGVGEFDGTSRASLMPWAGAWLGRTALVGTMGVAWLGTSTSSDGVVRRSHRGVLRPGLDLRYALMPRSESTPLPWLVLGAAGSIPFARDRSNAYTDEEQAQADQATLVERARLGGLGARVGAGVEVRITGGLSLGAEAAIEGYTSTLRAAESVSLNTWVGTRAAILLSFTWPDRALADQAS